MRFASCLLTIFFSIGMMANLSAQCVGGVCFVERTVATPFVANDYGIELAPGEILISVDGVPVSQRSVGPIRAAMSTMVDKLIVNRDERAYQHALREAQVLARRRTAGHPLGVAPGCRFSGTGISLSANRPNHCFLELPQSRLVARAMAVGSDGRFYWSAHYR